MSVTCLSGFGVLALAVMLAVFLAATSRLRIHCAMMQAELAEAAIQETHI